MCACTNTNCKNPISKILTRNNIFQTIGEIKQKLRTLEAAEYLSFVHTAVSTTISTMICIFMNAKSFKFWICAIIYLINNKIRLLLLFFFVMNWVYVLCRCLAYFKTVCTSYITFILKCVMCFQYHFMVGGRRRWGSW